MGYTHGTNKDSKTRVCTKCNQELPNTSEYFCFSNKKVGRLEAICKKCKKEIGKVKREKVKERNKNCDLFYEGTRHCIKCNRNLPNDKLHFPIDLSCSDGLRNICRECSAKYDGFLSPDYTYNEPWTDEDIKLLKSVYHDYTNEELVDKFFPNRTKHALDTQAGKYGFAWKTKETYLRSRKAQSIKVSQKLKGKTLSEETKRKISEARIKYYKMHDSWAKGKHFSKEHCKNISKSQKESGKWKGNTNPRHIKPLNGSLNGNWQGRMTGIYHELRSDTKDWFNESIKLCNYTCVISGLNFDNVHHTTSFKDIVDETFKIVNIDKRKTVSDYTEEEFDNLTDVLKNLHNKYGLGACVIQEVHKLFHDNYGYKNFSAYDFLDFVYRIDIGEFDNWFSEKNIPININYNYIKYLESTLSSLDMGA